MHQQDGSLRGRFQVLHHPIHIQAVCGAIIVSVRLYIQTTLGKDFVVIPPGGNRQKNGLVRIKLGQKFTSNTASSRPRQGLHSRDPFQGCLSSVGKFEGLFDECLVSLDGQVFLVFVGTQHFAFGSPHRREDPGLAGRISVGAHADVHFALILTSSKGLSDSQYRIGWAHGDVIPDGNWRFGRFGRDRKRRCQQAAGSAKEH
jgi:hypothetical protein